MLRAATWSSPVVDCQARKATTASADDDAAASSGAGPVGPAGVRPGAADGPAAPAAATGLQGLDSSASQSVVRSIMLRRRTVRSAVAVIGPVRRTVDRRIVRVDSLARWIARCRAGPASPGGAIPA